MIIGSKACFKLKCWEDRGEYKQRIIRKRLSFKKAPKLFEMVGLNKSTLYFKINLYNLLKKYPRLQINYLKNNFKKIKSVCKKKWS